MCGIGASIVCPLHAGGVDRGLLQKCVLDSLSPRGPDGTRVVNTPTTDACAITASVLHLRGEKQVDQPYIDRDGNLLAWNGEIYAGEVVVGLHDSDTLALSRRLEVACAGISNGGIAARAIHQVLSTVKGEWAFIYYHVLSRTLVYGRDPTGRRSLLVLKVKEEVSTLISEHVPSIMVISSTSGDTVAAHVPEYMSWVEIPPTGLFSLTLPSEECSCPSLATIEHYPWTPSLRLLGQPRLIGDPSPSALEEIRVLFQAGVANLLSKLSEAVRRRVETIPPSPCHSDGDEALPRPARLGILFSGGVDCMVIAALAHKFLPPDEPIDLLNVCFSRSNQSPDRLSAVEGISELRQACPTREWRLVRVNVDYSDAIKHKDRILQLCTPSKTHMDFNIGCAFWYSSQGKGSLVVVKPREGDAVIPLYSSSSSFSGGETSSSMTTSRSKLGKLICSQSRCGKVMKSGCGLNACKSCCTTIHKLCKQNIKTEVMDRISKGLVTGGEVLDGAAAIFVERIRDSGVPLHGIGDRLREGTICSVHRTRIRYMKDDISEDKLIMKRVIPPALSASITDSMVSPELLIEHGAVEESPLCLYTSTAKVLLVGIGADEQLGGYGRHRTAFRKNGWKGLADELTLDMNRLWKRNLGRDDRCISNNGKEARFPFLDEDVVSFISSLPLWLIADMHKAPGVGDKQLLREVAKVLLLPQASERCKRAIQFGSRVAKASNLHSFGSNRKAKGSSIFEGKGVDGFDEEHEEEEEE